MPVSSSDDGCLLYEHFEQLPAKNVIEIVNTSVCFNFESASIEASVRFFSVRRIDKMRMFLENSRYDPWTATMSSESLRSLLLFCKLGFVIQIASEIKSSLKCSYILKRCNKQHLR